MAVVFVTRASISLIPSPVFAEAMIASPAGRPITSSICVLPAQVRQLEDQSCLGQADLMVRINRLIDIGQRLRFDTLTGVNNKENLHQIKIVILRNQNQRDLGCPLN